MPIVMNNNNPNLSRIADEGIEVLSNEEAKHQDIRELHIGLLNMMPDAAFLATERQFFRLCAQATGVVQVYLHPIRCGGIVRSEKLSAHVDAFYQDFDSIKQEGLDALIVTGANPQLSNLTDEPYWQHATEIFAWANEHVTSIFFSCLSSHAMLQAQYDLARTPLAEKLWGIFQHEVREKRHPLVSNINNLFNMPHSRGNDVSEAEMQAKGLIVLASGLDRVDVGCALATSSDGFRHIFCQGHPEYDTSSLLKEYKREIERFVAGERLYPVLPKNYIRRSEQSLLTTFKAGLIQKKLTLDDFPESALIQTLDNTWRDTAKAIFANWLNLVYRTTHVERLKPYMDGIDPRAPIARWYHKD